MKNLIRIGALLAWGALMLAPAHAYQINDKLAIGGVLAGAYQYMDLSGAPDGVEEDGGAVPLQVEVSFTPTQQDEVFFKLGFAAGNGVNADSPFTLAPWAADMEDDVKNINGSGRDYLLTAWYKHTFELGKEHSLAFSGGIIDATDYVDQNAYSNDEYTQFMNEALVNGPSGYSPSYDLGAALEWDYGPWGLKGVYMNVNENDDGHDYKFYALQVGYRAQTSLGEGNFRVIYQGASNEFHNHSGDGLESRDMLLFSFDQELGNILGVWVRFGAQTDDAAVTYGHVYSGGINISGKLWGRQDDNIGIAYGLLDGGNQEVDNTNVAEAYLRLGLNDYLALTFDLQYMKDTYASGQEDLSGFIFGMRGTVEF
jgi:carbohydrate-selective porin (OprB family)